MNAKLSLAAVSLALMAAPALASPAAAPARPNIILLFADDMGWADISVQGAKTPTVHLDQLAATGQRWTHFYVSSPVCSPSRGGLMTGRLETRTGLYGAQTPVLLEKDPDGFPADEITIADSLRQNGYHTIMYGKWHLGNQAQDFPTRHGFDEWFGIPISNDCYSTQVDLFDGLTSSDPQIFKNTLAVVEKSNSQPRQAYWNVPLYHSYRYKGKQVDYLIPQGFQQSSFTKVVTEKAVNYIGENKNRPFFMYMAYPQTHVPLFGSPEFKGKGHNRYGDIMLEIDWSVGQIRQALKKNHLAENTIIIFTSDNGPWLMYDKYGISGSALPLRDGKSTPWEGGQRVPFIINWPGKIKPAVVEDIGSTLDLLPTLMKITGSTHAQKTLDGFDLSAAFLQRQPSPRTFMPYFYKGEMEAWREGDYKLVFTQYDGGQPKRLQQPLMFNMRTDSSEQHNIAAQEPERYQRLIKNAQDYLQSLGEKRAPLFDI